MRHGGIAPASIRIRRGRIAAIDDAPSPAGATVIDVGNLAVMPGVVDTHVHINEPGRSDWEGFATATAAAAAGGVTTLIDMPLNSIPPTVDSAAFHAKIEAAAGRCHVDVGFWGGLVADNLAALAPLKAAGVFGFKCFLSPSGVPEFARVEERDLEAAMPRLARMRAPLLVHAELAGLLETEWNGGQDRYENYLASRPHASEKKAVEQMVRLCRETRAPVHILHLSSADAAATIARARAEGLPMTAESCPHYLFFAAEEVPDGATEFKCAPPIRERENRERLWEALAGGAIDMVVSDHSPSPPDLKCRDSGDFARAWGGISSLELSLSATWTAASERGFSLDRVADWMCRAPAAVAGLDTHKGSIAPGCDADLVVFDPEASFTVDPARLYQRHKLTPYSGRTLKGVVVATYLRGEKIFERGQLEPGAAGEILLAG